MSFGATRWKTVLAAGILLLACGCNSSMYAQNPAKKKKSKKEAEAPVRTPPRTFRVDGGVKTETTVYPDSLGLAVDSLRQGTEALADGSSPASADSVGRFEPVDGIGLGSIVTEDGGAWGVSRDTTALSGPEGMRGSRYSRADSLEAESYGITPEELALLREIERQDSLSVALGEPPSEYPEVFMSRREERALARAERLADTTRINRIFRDTIPISRLTLYSAVLPGFGQLYNSQAWKIPILYGVVGTSTFFWMKEHKRHADYKSEYDYLMARNRDPNNSGRPFDDQIDRVRRKMMKHNTAKQLWMIGAIGSYLYFVGDAATNYPGVTNSVKKATTLSTIFPGAGQVYNKSYWKVPIVIGGIATFAMVIDWNNRGYKRYKDAYTFATDGDANTSNDLSERYASNPEFLKNMKNNFRRSRDLSIILAGLFYVFNIIDAHVDAHLKSYDISDDLGGPKVNVNVVPTMSNVSTYYSGNTQTVGLGLQITF